MSKLLSTLLAVAFGAFAIGAAAQNTTTPGSAPTAAVAETATATHKVTKKSVKKAKRHHHKTAAVKTKAEK